MHIQYTLEYNDEKETFLYKKINVEISENATIKELFDKIHEMENIPTYKEVTWNGNTEKITCSYHVLVASNSLKFQFLYGEDFQKKISEFPKYGPNGELSVYIENETGIAN
ncbi:hypothetical protein [uncultured Dokdonia sp.]|uniref:hypothetical protein n=1 Tax=uncultured Dokdonia sp. TaxID=575653 RepID=UPI00262FF7F2|nr:hypothetical protein [uncultured Dokdonia sp.]